MSNKTNHRVIVIITLVSLLSFAASVVAGPAEDELFTVTDSSDTSADSFDDFISYVWQLLTSTLSIDVRCIPSAVSIFNH